MAKPARRHGTARHGTARHGTARRGTARHGTARHGTARHGTARRGKARHGTARHGSARHGTARHGTARHGTARRGLVRHGTARHGTARYGTAQRGTASVWLQPGAPHFLRQFCLLPPLDFSPTLMAALASTGSATFPAASLWPAPTAVPSQELMAALKPITIGSKRERHMSSDKFMACPHRWPLACADGRIEADTSRFNWERHIPAASLWPAPTAGLSHALMAALKPIEWLKKGAPHFRGQVYGLPLPLASRMRAAAHAS